MSRTLPFIVVAGVLCLGMAYAEFAALATFEGFSLFLVLLLLMVIVIAAMLMVAFNDYVGRVADRWAPPLTSLHLITEEPSISSVDLESETDFESRWGYHVDLGGHTSEEPWAPGPSAGELPDGQVSDVADWLAMHAPLLLNAAGVAHTREVKGNFVRVVIPRLRESGFDVTVEAATFGVLVRTGMLFHAHFRARVAMYGDEAIVWEDEEEGEEEGAEGEEREDEEFYDPFARGNAAEQALGLVRDLLSPAVRIRERRAAGVPYYAALETRVGGEWRRRRAVARLRYAYWGKREERVWANDHLEPRTAD